MTNENIKVPQVPKYEEIKELKESEQERLIRENYEMEFDSYSDVGISRSYGPCLVGDISSCRCSKEELERQKALIELQREKEKLEVERKQREKEKCQEIERKKAHMKVAWAKWEEDKEAFLREQDSKFWGRDIDWKEKMPKPPSGNFNDY